MNPVRVSLQLAAADADGLALAQALGGAGNLNLNGVLVTGGVGEFDVARRVAIASVGDDSGLTWTVYGTDRNGNSQSESFAGANAGTVFSERDFLTVTRIAGSAATAGNVTAGSNAVGSTQWFVREWMSMGTLGVLMYFAAGIAATANFEITFDDPNVGLDRPPYQASPEPQSASPPIAVSPPGWSGLNASKVDTVIIPHFAWRLTVTAGTDEVVLQVIETTLATAQGG